MPSAQAICFCFGRFHFLSEHQGNAYFSGSLAHYNSPELGVLHWLRGIAKELHIKTDPFTLLEWQKTALAGMAAGAETLESVLAQSLRQHHLHATADVPAVAQHGISSFTERLEYQQINPKTLDKLSIHLRCALSQREVQTVPQLLTALRDTPKALIATGPQDLMQAGIEKLELHQHMQLIAMVAAANAEPFERIAESLHVNPEQLFVVEQHRWAWARIPPRRIG